MINQQILARARHVGCRFLLGTQYSLIIATAAVLSTIRSWVSLIFPLPCQNICHTAPRSIRHDDLKYGNATSFFQITNVASVGHEQFPSPLVKPHSIGCARKLGRRWRLENNLSMS